MPNNYKNIAKSLINWYLIHKRDLPWRQTKDPYPVWLSEVILQQTRVAQGLPYYETFLEEFPTVSHLADASQEKVLKLWQGLGYYSRARNLHTAAQYVSEELQGTFPPNYKELLALKGVGDYTASAIASICYEEPVAVVDGNVYRVLSRLFADATPINTPKGVKRFKQLAQELLDEEQPGTFNQAIMEFGARQCVPQNPDCDSCVLKDSCRAFQQDAVGEFPVKLKKQKIKKRYFNYLVFLSDEGETLLQQRTGKGIWQNLYEFPLVETSKTVSGKRLQKNEQFQRITDDYASIEINEFQQKEIVHKLSHQHLYAKFWIVRVPKVHNGISIENIHDYPVPVLIQNFIEEFSVFNS
ncbi:A/G-specific adenine glycosylase [Luteirhabdus pelagi]|jgi:A/G-specific adenine glycosylase|uniref:A/G-specific adenine glycosylase n=1 Tax=Luteirhabdus pelagi TaxID=2792783 RepID=UPI001939B5A3|nr:A/G-specific adenine glycosylase [Luteirhabdus pelagi]